MEISNYKVNMKILGKNFEVIEVDDTSLFMDKLGMVDFAKNRIYLAPNDNPEIVQETLLHEIIHAISFALGLKLSERKVTALSSGLYAVMMDNGYKIQINFEKDNEK